MGGVPARLRGEVTGLACTAYRKHASSRTPDASRQTFPGWHQSPASSSSPRAPRPCPGLAFLLASSPILGLECLCVPWGPPLPAPSQDPGPPCLQQSEEIELLSSPRPPPPLGVLGPCWGRRPNLTPSIDHVSGPLGWPMQETRGPCYTNNALVLWKHSTPNSSWCD